VSIFLCLVFSVTRVYLSVSCVQCYTCLYVCFLYPLLPVFIFLCLVSNVTRVYLSVSCDQCYMCLFFHWTQDRERYTRVPLGARHRKIDTGNIGHRSMLHVSIFLCLVLYIARVYLSVSCVQCYPCLFFSDFCPVLPVSIFLSLVKHTGSIGQKTQKDKPG
jgi:hypothetical protein